MTNKKYPYVNIIVNSEFHQNLKELSKLSDKSMIKLTKDLNPLIENEVNKWRIWKGKK